MILVDEMLKKSAGPEPVFDAVMRDFLDNNAEELKERQNRGSLLEAVNLGTTVPWLWRLTFHTCGLARDPSGAIVRVDRHTVGIRFLPDYLRRAERFEMLTLVEPARPFHPNLNGGAICVAVYPGQPLVEICEAFHALFSWKLRQLSENDALDKEACAWGRAHLEELPFDIRPLFGRQLQITLEPEVGT